MHLGIKSKGRTTRDDRLTRTERSKISCRSGAISRVALANVSLGLTAIYRALGGGWHIREDSNFVTAATRDEMRAQTNWVVQLPGPSEPQPPAPGLPSPADIGPTLEPPA